jgi:hypothetical protein
MRLRYRHSLRKCQVSSAQGLCMSEVEQVYTPVQLQLPHRVHVVHAFSLTGPLPLFRRQSQGFWFYRLCNSG